MADTCRVLLFWPGGLFSHRNGFGVPQLLALAGVLRAQDVAVDVVDLDMERAFGPVDLPKLLSPGYDLIGISCYSSYDYLKVMALAERMRAIAPNARFVTGGYHPSARPEDFIQAESPFDYVVVGDGEQPLKELVRALVAGKPPTNPVLTAEPFQHLDTLPLTDWTLLDRYRPIARQLASQVEVSLSRGCPYSCAFCMEKAKGCSTWRAYSYERATEELHRLDAYLDLSHWTLFITDALFGLSKIWRRNFLEELARHPIRARKIWLLTRADLLERDDLVMMAQANVSPGFGLESGSPEQLSRIQKAGSAEAFLEHMMAVSAWAKEIGLPFGANVIVGHPGETEATLRESAAYLEKLFLSKTHCTGFLSVDPFRLYPGSAIDRDLEGWQASTGFQAHRYPWWNDGDQDFLSEWVDPSHSLNFRQTSRLRFEVFGPLVHRVREKFSIRDPHASYFHRSLNEQVLLHEPKVRLRALGSWHLWQELLGEKSDGPGGLHGDEELKTVAREARKRTLLEGKLAASQRVLDALEAVPRERFVRLEDMGSSAQDRAFLLLDSGLATVSAMHAYALSFDALGLGPGDHLVDLGGGTGYGAALAAHVVGEKGRVDTIEIDESLHFLAQANLLTLHNIITILGDAHDVPLWQGATKVTVGFAVGVVPDAWLDALAVGGKLVAPVGNREVQRLILFEKRDGGIQRNELADVRYVKDRGRWD